MSSEPEADPRTDRIIEVAMQLAEQNGYDAVRLRDLASLADVALGTVYRRFSSKEDILAAALAKMVGHFYEAVTVAPVPGDTPHERVAVFLELATQFLSERPKLAAALLRAVASGDKDIATRVTSYKDTMTSLLVLVLRGQLTDVPPTPNELLAARLVQNLWFAEMVGWTGGLHSPEQAMDHVHEATALLLGALELP
ncbi:MAG: TetR/AcrR family transcriptional regulator [Alphaproteobacteria bacterium]|nr:TetR/AcrR family transcriptional regulator [Alphaproteobacteria bacterium]